MPYMDRARPPSRVPSRQVIKRSLKRHTRMTSLSTGSRPRDVPLACLVGFFAALAACRAGPEEVEQGDVGVDTIGGVEYVISPGVGLWETTGSSFRVDTVNAVRIGDSEGPRGSDGVVFGEVSGVVVDAEGRVHAADGQSRTIGTFDRDGELLSRIGGDGDGPGEFRYISGLIPIASGIAALDPVLNRVTLFDSSGTVSATIRLQRSSMVMEHFATFLIDERGELLDRVSSTSPDGTVEHFVVRYDPDGRVLERASVFSAEPSRIRIMDEMHVPTRYSPRVSLTFDPRGRVYVSRGDAYEIVTLSSSGDSLRVTERPLAGRPVSAENRAMAVADLEEIFMSYGVRPPPSPRIPDRFPVIRDLRVDRAGHLWVLHEPEPDAAELTWSVHDPEGRYLGDVSTPNMTVSQIGVDFLAGRAFSALGEPVAVVVPLER